MTPNLFVSGGARTIWPVVSFAVSQENGSTTHVFISCDPADSAAADRLQDCLESAGLSVWRDTTDLWPGQDRRALIRAAITDNALVFVACFSTSSLARVSSSQNEELMLAIEEIRRRLPEVPWIIPVRFDACEIPQVEIGGGRTLRSIQRADLFGTNAPRDQERLVTMIRALAGGPASAPNRPGPPSASALAAATWSGEADSQLDVFQARGSEVLRQPVVDLMDRQTGAFLTLRVAPPEAVSVNYAKEGISAAPGASYVLPHDLLVRALEAVGQPIVSGEIRGAPNRTLTARLTLANGRTVVSAPADAIALALRAQFPLTAPAALLDQAYSGAPGQHDDQAWLAVSTPRFEKPEREVPATLTGLAPNTVLVTVAGIGAGAEAAGPTALLTAGSDGRTVSISVSPIEAVAVDAAKRGEVSRCPSVYLLFRDLMSAVGAALVAVLVTRRSDGTVGADLMLSSGRLGPARTGDSLVLALLSGASIFASSDLPEAASLLD